MNTKFSVVTSDIKKVSVTITRKALWDNFVMCWKDTAWDDYVSARHLMDDVAKLLLSGDKLDYRDLCKWFREGITVMFMGEAMEHLDTPKIEIHREIVVDDDGEKHVIRHQDINF